MRDFLDRLPNERLPQGYHKGTIGCLLQMILVVTGIILTSFSFHSCDNEHTGLGTFYLILAILCWCIAGGIRYGLGGIFRKR